VAPEQGAVRVTVDSSTDEKTFVNFLTTKASVIAPDQTQLDIALPQVAPGRYEARIPASQEGAYFLNVIQQDQRGEILGARPAGFVVPYSMEYRDLRPNPELLQGLARATGGRALAEPSESFAVEEASTGQARELWQWLLALAGLFFMLDVAARRLRLQFVDVQRGWVTLQDRWYGRTMTPHAVGARLFQARSRSNAAIPTLHGPGAIDPTTGSTATEEVQPASSSALGNRLLGAKRRADDRHR
jgi:hypothetical protein